MSRRYTVTDTDRKATFATAARLGLNPYEFGAVLDKESGINPNIWGGAGGNYYGAIQFGDYERGEAGLDPKKIGRYTLAEQMPHIEKWLLGRGFKPGMGVDKVYATILAGNPNANLDAKDSFGTSVNNALGGLREGGRNYQRAQQVLGPTPEGALLSNSAFEQIPAQTTATYATGKDQTPAQTAAEAAIGTTTLSEFDANDFMKMFLIRQAQQSNSLVDNLIQQARSGGYVSAKDAMALFGGFE